MRILYITASLPFSRGGEVFFIPEIEQLIRSGHQLRIVPRSPQKVSVGGAAERLLPISEATALLSPRVLKSAFAESLRAPGAVLRSLWLILSHGTALTRIKNLAVFPKALHAGRLARLWGADHIHAQWAASTATMGLVAHAVSGIPWSFTAHRGDIVQRNLLPEKVRRASFVRLISQSGAALMADMGADPETGKLRVIHMGVSLPESPAAPTAAPVQRTFTVFCPANLIPVKGHRYLVEAVALLKARGRTCTLEIAGRGHLLGPLMKLAADSGVAVEVRFLGPLSHEKLLARYAQRSVAVVALPSVDLGGGVHEGIPVSLMEAMAHGLPVVSTATGGIPELVIPEAGIVVPPADAKALADALERLLLDPALREEMGQAGRIWVEREFNVVRAVQLLATEMRGAE